MHPDRLHWAIHLSCLVGVALATGCGERMPQNNSPLRDHDKELLAIPGVVGVYVALLDDGKTPCLKVMLARKTAETERVIPRTLEGYPVVSEVTGEIRPLGNP